MQICTLDGAKQNSYKFWHGGGVTSFGCKFGHTVNLAGSVLVFVPGGIGFKMQQQYLCKSSQQNNDRRLAMSKYVYM